MYGYGFPEASKIIVHFIVDKIKFLCPYLVKMKLRTYKIIKTKFDIYSLKTYEIIKTKFDIYIVSRSHVESGWIMNAFVLEKW